MKKLLVGVVALLAMTGMAMGQAAWSWGAVDPVDPAAGDVTVTIPLYITGAGNVDGVSLYLSVAAPLQFTGMSHLGTGMLFAGVGDDIPATIGDGSLDKAISTTSGSVALSANKLVANINVVVPKGAANGDYAINTTQDWGWMIGNSVPVFQGGELETTQATGFITVIPEPATALLLLGALPLLRRRHA